MILKSNGDVLLHLNFSRESLQALDKPLLFWASQDNISRIANQAGDLFSQRALPTFAFDEQALAQHQSLAMEARFADESYKTKEEYKELELKIKLLEKQLKEAEAEGLPAKRIADSLALPLAKAYADNQMAQAALELVERYGVSATSVVKNLRVIGDIYKQANEWERAIMAYERAIEKENPGNRYDLAILYSQLANVFLEMAQWEEALNWNLKAIEIMEGILSEDDPDLATSYNNLGSVYWNQGKLEKALEYHLKAIAIWEKILGPNHPKLAESYNNIGTAFHSQSEIEKALEYYLKATSILENIPAYDHPNLATAYNNIALVLLRLKNYPKAQEYMKKAIAIRKKQLPEGHPHLEGSIEDLREIEAKLQDQKNRQ